MRFLTDPEKKILIDSARKSIEHAVFKKQNFLPDRNAAEGFLKEKYASFVTLKINNELRGCIGSVMPVKDLLADVQDNAVSSAIRDPRFPPLSREEFNKISIEISVLHDFKNIENRGRDKLIETLNPGTDGIIIEENYRRATFLPSVWSIFPVPAVFLGKLLEKAGFPDTYWSDDINITLYRTESFS